MPVSNHSHLENDLWTAADELRANSKLRASDYSLPVLGLIFLKYADHKFAHATECFQAEAEQTTSRRRRDPLSPDRYKAEGVLYLPEAARYERLVKLPEGEDAGKAINAAMKAIEEHNEALKEVLPKTYIRFENSILRALLRIFNGIPMDIEGDVFGKIYEYFLGNFAMAEGQRGGEFFTPTSIVKLIVEIIEPFHGRIGDLACGSGGMFVQSARFVQRHQGQTGNVSIYGQERVADTVRLCKMNLAVNGLEGDVRQANSYYDDLMHLTGKLDFVMANPPFNVNRVDRERIKNDTARYPLGMPTVDNGNYLWIQLFYSALNATGRAGFVMANSASDARGSELELRKQLIRAGDVDVMVAIGSNFFYTVTLPCTLWFFDKGKPDAHKNTVLFIDARRIYTQVDRAHREFTPAQIEFLANIARLYRGETPETEQGSADLMTEHFPDGVYQDAPGLCKVATLAEIEAQGWSLNPGRYVGVPERVEDPDFDFEESLTELHEELELLNAEAHELEKRIGENVGQLLFRD
ncbi:MAG: SAM-dependent DNA methyltransferase [Anaerolineae bacterium]|nr:SAM-dependent DNA methyltransferase [Anaerolineae bacterium]